MRGGLGRWDRSRVVRVWIGTTGPGVRLALANCYWVSSPLCIGDTGRWGWLGQLRGAGLIRRRGIRTCCGAVRKQGYPVLRWALIDLFHRTWLGGRQADRRIRITAIRGGR